MRKWKEKKKQHTKSGTWFQISEKISEAIFVSKEKLFFLEIKMKTKLVKKMIVALSKNFPSSLCYLITNFAIANLVVKGALSGLNSFCQL